MIGIVAILLWGAVPLASLVTWIGSLTVVSAAAGLATRPVRPLALSVARRRIRGAVVVFGLVWGIGAVRFYPVIPPLEQAFLLVATSALVAGTAITLLADPTGFYLFLGAIVAGLTTTIGAAVPSATARMLGAAGLGSVAFLIFLFRRAHEMLRLYLEAAHELQDRHRDVEREQEVLDAILDAVPGGVVTVDEVGVVTRINPGFTRLFGYDRREACGRPVDELLGIEPETPAPERSDPGGENGPREVQRRHRDGHHVPVLVSSARLRRGESGDRCVVYDDLRTVKAAQQQLEETNEQFRQLVESSPDLVWRVDEALRCTYANGAVELVYGVPADEFVGRSFLRYVEDERREADREMLESVLEGAEVTEHRTVHRDARGGLHHLSLAARPIRDPDGTVTGVQGVARDVTDVARAMDALEEARAEAEQMASAKGVFLANMSHEIRTPMNGVIGMTELLLDTELTGEQRRAAELVRSSADALLALLNDILDYSRIEAGGITLEETVFDLHGLVDSVARIMAVRAFERGLELIVDIRPGVPRSVTGDPGRLRQVLSNLIGNAVKFTPQGEILVRVERAGGDDSVATLQFSVRDTGIGIPPDRLEAIFEEYAQSAAHTARAYGGTGLGLAISRRLARLMGGDLSVTSVVDHGSTFTLTIPLVFDRPEDTTTRPRAALIGARVLLVGSNRTSRDVVADMLRRVGVHVVEVRAADAALAEVRRRAAADDGGRGVVMVVDAHLAGAQDGFELARRVREDETLSSVRVMMLTSAGQRGDGRRCREVGIAAYLTKPVARTDLLEALATVLASPGTPSSSRDSLVTRHSIQETRRCLRVLLTEDNLVNQTVAVTMLQKRGHVIDVVATGEAAVTAARARRYDVIVMDINLPGMDGVEAFRAIRAGVGSPPVPVVAVTAHAMEGERERLLGEGFDGYLAKPFRPHELFAAIEGWGIVGDGNAQVDEGGGEAIDWDDLSRMMREAGIEDALQQLIDVFREDAPARMADLEEAIHVGDASSIESAAHVFKSAAGTVRANALVHCLHELEGAGRRGDVPGARKGMAAARQEYQAVLQALNRIPAVP